MLKKAILYAIILSSLVSYADTVDEAIQKYQTFIAANKDRMSWFIPGRSFAESRITDSLYACNDSWGLRGAGEEGCIKGWSFPVFYVFLPVLQATIEAAATPTVRLCGLPYLCYLAYKNDQAQDTIVFLKELKAYLDYKAVGEHDNKNSYYVNSKQLKPAYQDFKMDTDSQFKVSEFIDRVVTTITTKQYRFNNEIWSIDDFIDAATRFENEKDSFSMEERSVEDPETVACIICQDEKASGAFLPCGHFVSCEGCYKKLRGSVRKNEKPSCPKCRQPIENMQKIYQ